MSTPQIIGTSHSIVQRDGQTYIAVDGMTPDQIITWMHDHHRKQAFAAIRRTVKFARELQQATDSETHIITYGGQQMGMSAAAIRYAIRRAIGSDKA